MSWEHFPDGWPNLFIENVKQDCAGRDGEWFPQDVFYYDSLQAILTF